MKRKHRPATIAKPGGKPVKTSNIYKATMEKKKEEEEEREESTNASRNKSKKKFRCNGVGKKGNGQHLAEHT